jgi:hypothetical protein
MFWLISATGEVRPMGFGICRLVSGRLKGRAVTSIRRESFVHRLVVDRLAFPPWEPTDGASSSREARAFELNQWMPFWDGQRYVLLPELDRFRVVLRHVEDKLCIQPDRLWVFARDLQRPMIGRDRNTIPPWPRMEMAHSDGIKPRTFNSSSIRPPA